ncbi:MAG: ATP-binding protein [Calditrichaeota bacterium]|nr:MAG: ATP-binding protein [Calditrichota bacterium]
MDIYKRIIKEYEAIPFQGLPRGFDPELYRLQSAVTIIGPRRAGKTTYLREIIHTLNLSHFLFLNFEDERILHLPEIDPFLEAYYELYQEKPHIFLDEVQNAQLWHQKVRRLIDQGYKVFLTGSNANLLSKEIATHLAGRTFVKTILPFSFLEMLRLKGIEPDSQTIYGEQRFTVKNLFGEYLVYGGFPEVIQTALKKELLRQYFDMVFYRDLVSRYRIRQETVLRLLIKKLHENIGSPYRVSALRNKIAQFMKVSKQTIFDYLHYLEEAYMMVHVQNYRRSFMVRETERKSYFIDNGFVTILSLEDEPGKLLEQGVFLELLKRGREVYYFREKYECDFVAVSEGRIAEVIQTTWRLTDQNRDREVRGLLETLKKVGKDTGFILTENQDETLEVEGKQILVRPAWRWILG